MFEYSDLPMDFETFGVPKGQHIPGDVVHAYFQAYARKFDLLKRIQFRSRVTSVRMEDDGTWLIKLLRDGETSLLRARKLVLATGTTSEPNMPSFEGEANFGGKIMHSKELRYSKTEAEALGSRERVAVLRGSKSAVDAVYMYASRGVHVDWIIRGEISCTRSLSILKSHQHQASQTSMKEATGISQRLRSTRIPSLALLLSFSY